MYDLLSSRPPQVVAEGLIPPLFCELSLPGTSREKCSPLRTCKNTSECHKTNFVGKSRVRQDSQITVVHKRVLNVQTIQQQNSENSKDDKSLFLQEIKVVLYVLKQLQTKKQTHDIPRSSHLLAGIYALPELAIGITSAEGLVEVACVLTSLCTQPNIPNRLKYSLHHAKVSCWNDHIKTI